MTFWCEAEYDDDAGALSQMKGILISHRLSESVCRSKKTKDNLTTSDKIDKIVTNRWAALPIFRNCNVYRLLYFRNYSRYLGYGLDE